MKQTFIQFPARNSFRYQSRRFPQRAHMAVAYKTDAEAAAEAERTKLLKEIREQFEGELQKRGYFTKAEVDAAIVESMKPYKDLDVEAVRSYKTDKAGLEKTIGEHKAALEAQGLELRAMKDAQLAALPDRKTIATEIRAAIDKNKEAFDRFKRGESRSFGTDTNGNSNINLGETRAAATMTVSGSTGGSAFVPGVQMLPGLVDLARNQPFLEDYANTSVSSSPRIVWTEKTNPQGNAAFLAEGGVKSLISIEIKTVESYAKKVADKIKVSTEMLDDIDFIAGEIEKELRYKVDIAVDSSLLSGAGDGSNGATDLKGLTSQVGGYVLTNIATTTPNDFDAIRAGAAQIVSLNFSPNVVFYNTIDGANMDMVKDAQGRPIAVLYKDQNGKIYRLTPIETNQMPIGFVLIGDMTRFKVRNYQPFSISYGWVNDDFEKNLVTILGERRLHAFVATNDIGAFVYDTFANIKTAITAP